MANGWLCGLGNFVIYMNPPIVPVQLLHPACCINGLEASCSVQLPQRRWSVLTRPHFFLHSDGNLCIFCSFPPTTVPFFSLPPSSDRLTGCALTKHQPSALTLSQSPLRCPEVVCGIPLNKQESTRHWWCSQAGPRNDFSFPRNVCAPHTSWPLISWSKGWQDLCTYLSPLPSLSELKKKIII